MTIKYANGFKIQNSSTVYGDCYTLEETPLFNTIEEAAGNLVGRIQVTPELAGDLQMLSCSVDENGDVANYKPVMAGQLIEALLWLKLIK